MPTHFTKKEKGKKDKNNTKTYVSHVEIDPNMPDLSNDPYFVKKAEAAKAILAKGGFPEEFYKRK